VGIYQQRRYCFVDVEVGMNNIIIPILRNLYPNLIARQIVGVQPMTAGPPFSFEIRFDYRVHPRYKFSRKWYVGEINSNADKTDIIEWCELHFGSHPKNPDAWCRWYRYSTSKFYFRDEKDYALFLLRWT